MKQDEFVVICRSLDACNHEDGYRLIYKTLDEGYRKLLHTIWYYLTASNKNNIICSLFRNNRIVYNFTKINGKSRFADCLDGSKTNNDLNQDVLSKMILNAIIEYEAIEHAAQTDN